MKKILASLPMIGLILGAVAIATELKEPMSFGEIHPIHTSVYKTQQTGTISSSSSIDKKLAICVQ